jgi:hypothetical protein
VSQLTTAVTGTDITGAAIPPALQAKWKGPYISRDQIANTGGGNTIQSTFVSSSSYLAVAVTVASGGPDFANLEAILDEGTASSSSSTLGNIRMSGTTNILFLALPIQ